MKQTLLIALCALWWLLPQAAQAQEGGRTLPPNYRRMERATRQLSSPYFRDSLEARFGRCDTTLTVDHLRCLYFGDTLFPLVGAHRHYRLLAGRLGALSPRVGEAWWQYQMLLSAVWSTGDGSRRKPLHVASRQDAELVAADFGAPLWFKMKGRRRFSVAPPR